MRKAQESNKPIDIESAVDKPLPSERVSRNLEQSTTLEGEREDAQELERAHGEEPESAANAMRNNYCFNFPTACRSAYGALIVASILKTYCIIAVWATLR